MLLEGNVFWWQVFPQTSQGRCGFFLAWSMSGAETVDSDTSLSSAGPRKTLLRCQSDIHMPSVMITVPVPTLIKAAGRDTPTFHLPLNRRLRKATQARQSQVDCFLWKSTMQSLRRGKLYFFVFIFLWCGLGVGRAVSNPSHIGERE